jgi:hypothetical protein
LLVEPLGQDAFDPSRYREHFGELRFHEALLGDKAIPIPDEVIGQRKIWREIGELVRQANEPLHLREFCQHIGTKDASRAAHHVRKAERAGLIKKIGWAGGWVIVYDRSCDLE